MKNVKHLLTKCGGKFNDDFHMRLSEWRNSPRHDGFSPAQLLYGRRQKGNLPVLPTAYDMINVEKAVLKRQHKQDANKSYFDGRTRPSADLTTGTKVVVQNTNTLRWDVYGIITAIYQSGRCLKIKLENGRTYFRN